jgi:hypothetical protein
MNPQDRFERVAELPFNKLGEQILVVVAKTREVHLLNESAARIWELLETPATLDGLMETLQDEFDLDPGTVGEEVRTVVTEMMGKGLVRSHPA